MLESWSFRVVSTYSLVHAVGALQMLLDDLVGDSNICQGVERRLNGVESFPVVVPVHLHEPYVEPGLPSLDQSMRSIDGFFFG